MIESEIVYYEINDWDSESLKILTQANDNIDRNLMAVVVFSIWSLAFDWVCLSLPPSLPPSEWVSVDSVLSWQVWKLWTVCCFFFKLFGFNFLSGFNAGVIVYPMSSLQVSVTICPWNSSLAKNPNSKLQPQIDYPNLQEKFVEDKLSDSYTLITLDLK